MWTRGMKLKNPLKSTHKLGQRFPNWYVPKGPSNPRKTNEPLILTCAQGVSKYLIGLSFDQCFHTRAVAEDSKSPAKLE